MVQGAPPENPDDADRDSELESSAPGNSTMEIMKIDAELQRVTEALAAAEADERNPIRANSLEPRQQYQPFESRPLPATRRRGGGGGGGAKRGSWRAPGRKAAPDRPNVPLSPRAPRVPRKQSNGEQHDEHDDDDDDTTATTTTTDNPLNSRVRGVTPLGTHDAASLPDVSAGGVSVFNFNNNNNNNNNSNVDNSRAAFGNNSPSVPFFNQNNNNNNGSGAGFGAHVARPANNAPPFGGSLSPRTQHRGVPGPMSPQLAPRGGRTSHLFRFFLKF